MTITAVTGSRRQLQHIALVHQAFASSRRAADFAHGIHVESALLRQVSRLSDLDRLRLSRSTGQVLLVALHSFVEVERALALRAVGGHGAARAALLARHAVWLVAMLVLLSGWSWWLQPRGPPPRDMKCTRSGGSECRSMNQRSGKQTSNNALTNHTCSSSRVRVRLYLQCTSTRASESNSFLNPLRQHALKDPLASSMCSRARA